MTTPTMFSDDLKLTPYWWDDVPRPALPPAPMPAKADVVVIGSGYTGLAAALQTARGGRHTVVLDAQDAGFGCSTRNGGQISTSVKPDYAALARRFGREHAFRIVKEGHNSLAWVGAFVKQEGIDCDFRIAGRFHAAHNPARYEALARMLASQPKGLEVAAHMVPREDQSSELGTDAYYGGILYEHHASVHPALLHQGMLDRVLQAGATVIPHCPATGIDRDATGFRVACAGRTIAARNVVIATNGYTGRLMPWLRRRVIPIGSYIIATEPLPLGVMSRLMPRDRIVSDTRKVVYYYRASPDGRRILFGGRVSCNETDPRRSAPPLHAELVRLFPDIRNVRISHSWAGFVAYTFDQMMHAGQRDGLFYAMGYCGSGAGMAGYLGTRIGQQVLGRAEGKTAFDDVPFESRPYYWGNPWFLAPSVAWYRWRDRSGH
ncbi:MAG TPA: FAD-binding oxidoreductase [Acetobacteraceae bacterium]|nr:FAD-binding oxidoreductase [Acetobacteraceae bacterium]